MSDETTDPIPAALREAILAGDRRGVLDLVRDLRDPDRLVLGPAMETRYFELKGTDWTSPSGRDRHQAFQLARLAIATTPQHAGWSLLSDVERRRSRSSSRRSPRGPSRGSAGSPPRP